MGRTSFPCKIYAANKNRASDELTMRMDPHTTLPPGGILPKQSRAAPARPWAAQGCCSHCCYLLCSEAWSCVPLALTEFDSKLHWRCYGERMCAIETCVCMHASACEVCIRMCVCVHVYMCVRVCVCVYVCMCWCARASLHKLSLLCKFLCKLLYLQDHGKPNLLISYTGAESNPCIDRSYSDLQLTPTFSHVHH